MQPPFIHTTASLANLEAALSAERFATYLTAVGGDRSRALALYEWNGAVSAAFYFPLQAVEVALRNACGRELEVLFGASWPRHPGFIALDPQFSRTVTEAEQRLHSISAQIDTPRLLAELSFGFWTSLFGHHFDRTLWVPGLYRAFPHFRRVTGKPIRRPAVAQRFHYLRKLRNRIAHHEPIFARSLADDHESLLEVADWMYPDLRAWIASVSTLPSLLAVRPQLAP